MIRLIEILLATILVSFFFFPIEFTFLPGVNTKMILAVIGLLCAALEMIRHRSPTVPLELLELIGIALLISMASLFSITINATPDNTFVTYFVSFFVWLSAAFATCYILKAIHDRIDIQLIINYLTVVCVAQCVLALLIDANPFLARWVNMHFFFGQDVAIRLNRLYGIGASLDVASIRLSVVLVGIAFYLSEITKTLSLGERVFYIVSFFAISVVGNMIARTAMVGMVIGILFMLAGLFIRRDNTHPFGLSATFTWLGLIFLGIVVSVILYKTDTHARHLFRFGFEGFFNLVETGQWVTSSTEKLKTMIVWPETLHTWIIGDGYFLNPRYDENYFGDTTDKGFYMGTDIGYLRFIFYFGIVGLIPMISLIVLSALICIRFFYKERYLFILALAVGLIVWMKVSTDVFLFFAIFLSAAALQDKEDVKSPCTSSTT